MRRRREKFILLFFLIDFLNANTFYTEQNIYNLLIFIILTLFLILAFLIYKRKKVSSVEVIESKKPEADFEYMNNMVKTIRRDYSSFLKNKNSINLEKSILFKLKELSIFLEVKSDSIEIQRRNINFEEFVTKISHNLSTKNNELNIVIKNDISYSIITDIDILINIFTLLTFLQYYEHNLKNAYISIEVKEKDKRLILSIDNGLSYNSHMKKVLEDSSLTPYYHTKEKFYYGLYLFLLNRYVRELNGVLTINILEKTYTVDVEIPVSLEIKSFKSNMIVPKEIENKLKALIICKDMAISKSIANFLNFYKINTEIINSDKVVQVPNFTEYDMLFTDSEFLNSIFAEYLLNIKKYHNIKVIAIKSNKNIFYRGEIVDELIEKPILQSKIYNILIKLFNQIKNESSLIREKKDDLKKKNNKKKVLVADDNLINRNLLKTMIESYGVQVVTAVNGEEVLEILNSENDINLVILDSIMPKLDAYETIKKIRAEEKFNTIPVVINSSFSFNGKTSSIDEIFKLGFDSYLPKPFTIEKLESILLRYLGVEPIVTKKDNNKKEDFEEFIAIYGNSDKMIEKYVKENRLEQLKALLIDLKNISSKLDKEKLYNEAEALLDYIKENKDITLDIIEPLVKEINITKFEVASKLDY